tara:strand:- start:145 stop:270 length:126 start_codon:yes stop_codon:yes gene_type:complete
MAETNIVEFAMWSGITAILMLVTGIIYKKYRGKKSNENFAS